MIEHGMTTSRGSCAATCRHSQRVRTEGRSVQGGIQDGAEASRGGGAVRCGSGVATLNTSGRGRRLR